MSNFSDPHILLPRRTQQRYGWRRDLPDYRDYRVDDFISTLKPVPAGLTQFSLRQDAPERPWDQSNLGCCVGHGTAFVWQFQRKKQGLSAPRPSRLAIYYGARLIEGDANDDAGAEIRDGIKVLATIGAADESLWPYDITQFAQQPPQAYFDQAKTELALAYWRSPTSIDIFKRCIYNGYPIVFGFTVYESFETQVGPDGLMPMPGPKEDVLGGHCTVHMGWDDAKRVPGADAASTGCMEVRNSWGTSWGDQGHFWMPYAYAQDNNLCGDCWVVTSESGA